MFFFNIDFCNICEIKMATVPKIRVTQNLHSFKGRLLPFPESILKVANLAKFFGGPAILHVRLGGALIGLRWQDIHVRDEDCRG